MTEIFTWFKTAENYRYWFNMVMAHAGHLGNETADAVTNAWRRKWKRWLTIFCGTAQIIVEAGYNCKTQLRPLLEG